MMASMSLPVGESSACSVMETTLMPRFLRGVGKGTGLGLSMCHRIAREHGGEIHAESVPGHGATFIVELPVAEGSSPTVGPVGVGVEDAHSERARVLVVDDEPAVAGLLRRTLAGEGHSVDVASRGSNVVGRSDLDSYDLILLDIKMPGLGGEALFDHMRQLPGGVSSRIVFVTGDTANITTQEFIQRTGNPVLSKPFALEELMETVRRFAVRPRG